MARGAYRVSRSKSCVCRGYLILFDGCQNELADARVAELVDALASGASARKGVGVQVPPRAQPESSLKTGLDQPFCCFSDRYIGVGS